MERGRSCFCPPVRWMRFKMGAPACRAGAEGEEMSVDGMLELNEMAAKLEATAADFHRGWGATNYFEISRGFARS